MIRKSYKNFRALHGQLQCTFVNSDEQLYSQIPQMPPKVVGLNSSKDLLQALEVFMNSILENEGLCHLMLVKNFLTEGIVKYDSP